MIYPTLILTSIIHPPALEINDIVPEEVGYIAWNWESGDTCSTYFFLSLSLPFVLFLGVHALHSSLALFVIVWLDISCIWKSYYECQYYGNNSGKENAVGARG